MPPFKRITNSIYSVAIFHLFHFSFWPMDGFFSLSFLQLPQSNRLGFCLSLFAIITNVTEITREPENGFHFKYKPDTIITTFLSKIFSGDLSLWKHSFVQFFFSFKKLLLLLALPLSAVRLNIRSTRSKGLGTLKCVLLMNNNFVCCFFCTEKTNGTHFKLSKNKATAKLNWLAGIYYRLVVIDPAMWQRHISFMRAVAFLSSRVRKRTAHFFQNRRHPFYMRFLCIHLTEQWAWACKPNEWKSPFVEFVRQPFRKYVLLLHKSAS